MPCGILLKVYYQRSLVNFRGYLSATNPPMASYSSVIQDVPFFHLNSAACLINIDGVEASLMGSKRMLLPRFSVDFCTNFPLKTGLGLWPLANTCILLFRLTELSLGHVPNGAVSGSV